MIDIHSHILPSIDDGSKSWDETMLMATLADRDQITILAATPHANPGYHDVPADVVRKNAEELNRRLEEEGRELRIVTGHDAHLVPELLQRLKDKEVLTINDSRYFLLEPPEFFRPEEFLDNLFTFMAEGFLPVITHPERIGTFLRNRDLLYKIAAQGGLIQVTAGSVMGYFGARIQAFTEWMLIEGLVHVIASDAHSPRHRPPILSLAAERIAGMDVDPEPMILTIPKAIVEDEEIEIDPPPALHPSPNPLRRILGRLLQRK